MENSQNLNSSQAEGRISTVEDLYLDTVVASQPEIGPTPPDGGYGWLIIVSAVIYHVTVPGILSLYGIVILKAIREEDHERGELMKIWDVDIALVPVIAVVIRLLLESWCRAVVKIFNMPRFMALAGLCLTVAGVLLSSHSTDADSNDHIINVFSGIFVGAGSALTGQQTEVIITHYFREKLTTVQRIVRMAPSVGNCLVPLLVGYLCTIYTGESVVMIYGAIVMQNCVFLATYSRPIYIERVIKSTYNVLRDAVEDEDEVIFSNQTGNQQRNSLPDVRNAPGTSESANQDEDATDVVVFNSKKNAKEILDPSVQYRENRGFANEARFSSDFSSVFETTSNRFSSDFGTLDINNYSRIRYQELENIDRQNPQPLYRETTMDAPQSNVVFPTDVSPGTVRRTATLKKNFITINNMLRDINFYLYALLHLSTTFSILILGVVFPPLIWEQNPSMNISSVSVIKNDTCYYLPATIAVNGVFKMLVSAFTAAAHGSALCFIALCVVLPKSINEKARLCAAFGLAGAVGFYGITVTLNKSLLVVWCMLASFSTAATSILQQSLYNSTLNEFDTTATMTASNAIVAIFIMIWSLIYNYEYKTCFLTASFLQVVTACIFFVMSFRRRR